MSSKSSIYLLAAALALLACSTDLKAAFEQDRVGPRSLGMGGAGVALCGDGWMILRNPAASHDNRTHVAGGWSQPFGLPELNQESFAANRHVNVLSLGIAAASFGSDLYRESSMDLSIAGDLRAGFAAGIAVGVRSLSIQDYSDGSAAAIGLGILAVPTDAVRIGLAWQNLNRGRIDGFQERLPERLTIGGAARIGDFNQLVFDLVSEKHFPVETRFGIESSFNKHLDLRVGARLEPFRPSCGIGVGFKNMRFHYAGDLHPDLGASHSVGLGFQVNK